MSDSLFKKHFESLRNLQQKSQSKKIVIRRDLSHQKILIVSPHPDDEILQAGLALRLQKENKVKVINVAVTLGSKVDQQARRKKELAAAIKFLQFKNYILSDSWVKKKNELKEIIKNEAPCLIIAPHRLDQHSTHQLTSKLVSECTKNYKGKIAWSEFWSAQEKPNLMVEVPYEIFSKQYKALQYHKGEIERNPYHLRLQSWLIDNVRRGSEIIQKSGAQSAPILMGQLYRIEGSPSCSPFALQDDDLSDWLE